MLENDLVELSVKQTIFRYLPKFASTMAQSETLLEWARHGYDILEPGHKLAENLDFTP